jgi:subtilisin family serine protease
VLLAVLAATTSAVADPGAISSGTGAATAPDDAIVPGRLVLRLHPTEGEALDRAFAAGRGLGTTLRAPKLDALGQRFGLRSVTPLRRADTDLATVGERRGAQTARRARAATLRRARGRPAPAAGTPDFTGVYVLELAPDADVTAAVDAYATDPAVVWAEPVRRVQTVLVPNDPFLASSGSWGQNFADLWGLPRIGMPAAWDVARGDGVVVAVTDTGLDVAHPDIQTNVWVNTGEVAGNGVDDDANGYIDDVHGFDFVNGDGDPFDDHGHGTHVAGTVAATGGNALGLVGVAFESRIMGLKGLDAGGGGTTDELAEAILYAVDNGADVINASWGGGGASQLIDDALEAAHAAGVVFVAAAGNNNADLGVYPFFPASNARAVTVAAFDHLDQRAFFSNYGPKIDVAAPGGGDACCGPEAFRSVLSLRASGAGSDMTGGGQLVVSGNYLRQAGTSMAAPHVAGAAAVLLSAHPGFGPEQIRHALRTGADDVGPPGVDADSGYGMLNVAGAVVLDVPDVDITAPAPGITATGSSLTVTGSAAGTAFANYRVEFGSGAYPSAWTTIAGPVTTPVVGDTLTTWDIDPVPDGAYALRLVVTTTQGTAFESRLPLTLDRRIISEPASLTIQRLAGPIEIRGTAGGGAFASFRVEWRIAKPDFTVGPWRTDGMTLAGGGVARVAEDLLATFDAPLTANTDVDLRLVITRTGGGADAEETRHVVLDPTLRAGWPQRIPGLPQFLATDRLLQQVTIADVDDDGSKEILTAYGDEVWIYRHDGTALPGWPQRLQGGTAPTPLVRRAPAAADLDGDGDLEIVAAETEGEYGTGSIFIWHHDGTPMAGWPREILQAYERDPDNPLFPGTPRGAFALADVDGNGQRDIVAVIGPSLVVLDVQGNFLPGWPQRWPLSFPCVTNPRRCYQDVMAVGDVDGDGTREIAIVTTDINKGSQPEILILYDSHGNIMPGFPAKASRKHYGTFLLALGQRGAGFVTTPIMADLDGDGDLEIVLPNVGRKPLAYHHTGKKVRLGSVKGTKNRKCNVRMAPVMEIPTAGDLDGDGAAEVLVGMHTAEWKEKRSANGNVSSSFCEPPTQGPDFLWAHRGVRGPKYAVTNPGWPLVFAYPRGDNAYGPGSAAVADVDGDGRPNVVVGTGICGDWQVSLGLPGHRCFPVQAFNAAGALLPGFPKATPGPGPSWGSTPAVGDLDGDGLKEIVFVDFFGHIMVWTVPGTPGPEVAEWPMYQHDAAHTGALQP